MSRLRLKWLASSKFLQGHCQPRSSRELPKGPVLRFGGKWWGCQSMDQMGFLLIFWLSISTVGRWWRSQWTGLVSTTTMTASCGLLGVFCKWISRNRFPSKVHQFVDWLVSPNLHRADLDRVWASRIQKYRQRMAAVISKSFPRWIWSNSSSLCWRMLHRFLKCRKTLGCRFEPNF